MAPPAGTSSMLRSRRRDAALKPNRSLDRSASRGMLYENEELRLRTININAEVEKGQNYIKKLRRENEQLKREIWNLREEYEKLENYVKSREQSEEEDEGGGGDVDDGDQEAISTQSAAAVLMSETAPATATVLETVIEEDDNPPADDPQPQKLTETMTDDGRGGNVVAPQALVITDGDNHNGNVCGDNSDVAVRVVAGREDERTATAAVPVALTADVLAVDPDRPGGGDRRDDDGADCVGQHHHHQLQHHRLEVYDYNCAADDGDDHDHGPRRHPDEAVLQPHTACFDIGSNRQLHDLTVDEVVNAIEDTELREKLRTVSLTDDRCYMTFANAECLERALHTAVLRIRDVSVLLMDTGAGAIILSLTGVPDTVADKDVLKCLKRYGTIIGGVERKTSRGGTMGGERYVRVRPTLGAPRYLWFGSDKVVVRQLTEHETGTMNSVARRKSFRSQIKLNLKMADAHRAASVVVATSAGPSPSSGETGENRGGSGSGGCARGGDGGVEAVSAGGDVKGCGVAVGSATTTTVSVQNGFRFPSQDPKTTTGGGAPATESSRTAPVITANGAGKQQQQQQTTTGGGSIKKSKPAAPTTDGCTPLSTSSGTAESSPLRGRRRPSLMGFRRDTVKYRGGSVSRADGGGGEDADSDTSPICRRKLSIKGHERTEKVPWCGCWGNGCL